MREKSKLENSLFELEHKPFLLDNDDNYLV
jgi:hypothetical protein